MKSNRIHNPKPLHFKTKSFEMKNDKHFHYDFNFQLFKKLVIQYLLNVYSQNVQDCPPCLPCGRRLCCTHKDEVSRLYT
jgi:hypothetical protein